jgi:hypothetical protein
MRGRTLRSSESEGGCFGGFRRRNEGYHGFIFPADPTRSAKSFANALLRVRCATRTIVESGCRVISMLKELW